MSLLFTLLAFIVAISILVTVHEFGHYWVARRNGVKIEKFSIGFGRPLFKWVRGTDKTEYIIAAIPMGGYVKMLGEGGDVEVPVDEKHRAFNNKSLLQRTSIVAAGPIFNLLLALFLYWFLFTGNQQGISPVIAVVEPQSIAAQAGLSAGDHIVAVAGQSTPTWDDVFAELKPFLFEKRPVRIEVSSPASVHQREVVLNLKGIDLEQQNAMDNILGIRALVPVVIGEIVPDSAAAGSDLQPGDHIVQLNQIPLNNPAQMSQLVRDSQGQALSLQIMRGERRLDLTVTPRLQLQENGEERWLVGIIFAPQFDVEYEVGVLDGLAQAGREVWDMSYLTLNMFYRMAIGEASLKNLSGPVTIAEYAGKTASISGESFMFFLAIVSISLGIINLLPIPMLDGGHLMYFAIEAVKGSPVSEETMITGQKIGIVILLVIMSIAISNDIQRIMN